MNQPIKKYSRSDLGVYVWTSDRNMPCVQAWAYLFNKFWPYKTNVRVLGYAQPEFELPDNFEFISLGKQRGVEHWSNDMLNYYQSCDHEYFYSMWEDGLILNHIDAEILDLALKVAIHNKGDRFFKFNLSLDVQQRPHSVLEKFDGYDLILASQTSAYRHSTNHCIWKREKFLDKLIPGQTPWKFELDNTRAQNDSLDIYATRGKYAITMGHAYKKGTKISNWYEENSGYGPIPRGAGHSLTQEDIQYIEKNNWIPEIPALGSVVEP